MSEHYKRGTSYPKIYTDYHYDANYRKHCTEIWAKIILQALAQEKNIDGLRLQRYDISVYRFVSPAHRPAIRKALLTRCSAPVLPANATP